MLVIAGQKVGQIKNQKNEFMAQNYKKQRKFCQRFSNERNGTNNANLGTTDLTQSNLPMLEMYLTNERRQAASQAD